MFERQNYGETWLLGLARTITLIAWSYAVEIYEGVSESSLNEWVRAGGGIRHDLLSSHPWRFVTPSMHHASPHHLIVNGLLLQFCCRPNRSSTGQARRHIESIDFKLDSNRPHDDVLRYMSCGRFRWHTGHFGAICIRMAQHDRPNGIRDASVIAVLAIAMGQLGWGFNPDHFFDLLAGAALALITLKQLAIRFAFHLSIAIYILGLLWFFLESFTE